MAAARTSSGWRSLSTAGRQGSRWMCWRRGKSVAGDASEGPRPMVRKEDAQVGLRLGQHQQSFVQECPRNAMTRWVPAMREKAQATRCAVSQVRWFWFAPIPEATTHESSEGVGRRDGGTEGRKKSRKIKELVWIVTDRRRDNERARKENEDRGPAKPLCSPQVRSETRPQHQQGA